LFLFASTQSFCSWCHGLKNSRRTASQNQVAAVLSGLFLPAGGPVRQNLADVLLKILNILFLLAVGLSVSACRAYTYQGLFDVLASFVFPLGKNTALS
jgi:hypothetical protein